MNTLIENLNLWSERLLQFAWPMLWQSSLLIALVFVVEYLLRRKVRAAIRYSLWLVVLFKLVLPPSLALPTSAAWWLRPATPAPPSPIQSPPTTAVIVRYELPIAPVQVAQFVPAVSPSPVSLPRAPMTCTAWAFVAWSAIAAGLLVWLTARWRRVARTARNAGPLPAGPDQPCAADVLFEAKRLAGVRRTVRLRVIDRPISPAVYGWFRPVILLPRSLVVQLSGAQLRSVLVHELIHLRRGDVWVNCAQALLQIVYWWHPLLWFANARIRRVREEAVDDAVMLALRHDADSYAPTLLEVAKLAFARPPVSLGLVGILESRSALRQRIERLVNIKPPRRAGLSVGSLLAIAAFSALAVPMGEAPLKRSTPTPPFHAPIAAQGAPSTRDETAEEPIEVEADSVEYDAATGIQYARGSVVIHLQGRTYRADSATVAPGQITATHVTFRNGRFLGTAETFRWNVGTKKVRVRSQSAGAEVSDEPVAVQADSLHYDSATGIQHYRGSVVVLVRGMTLHADSVDFDRGTGELVARGHVRLETNDASYAMGNQFQWRERFSNIRTEQRNLEAPDILPILDITVDKDGGYWLGTNSLGLAELRTTMEVAKIVAGKESLLVRIHADANASFTSVKQLVDLCQEFEISSVSLRTSEARVEADPGAIVTNSASDLIWIRTLPPAVDDALRKHFGRQGEQEVQRAISVLKSLPAAPRSDGTSFVPSNGTNRGGSITNGLSFAPPGTVPGAIGRSYVPYTGPGRQVIMSNLNSIRFDKVSYSNAPLAEIARSLSRESRERDPERRGINFVLDAKSTNTDEIAAFNNARVKIALALTDIRLRDVLAAIVSAADRPIQYSIRDYAVVFSPSNPTNLYMRRFKVDPNAFLQAIQDWNGVPVDFFLAQGVDLRPGTGKGVFWAYYAGLMINATSQDLDNVQAVIDELNLAKSPFANPTTAYYRDPHFDWRQRDFQTALSNFDSVLTTPWPPGGAASRSSNASANLWTRTFRVDPNGFDWHRGNFLTAASNFDSVAEATFPAPNPFTRRPPSPAERSNLTERLSRSPVETSTLNNNSPTNLQTFRFKVDPDTFFAALESVGALPPHQAGSPRPTGNDAINATVRNYFLALGVDTRPPTGKDVAWNDRQGVLTVRATARDLAIIETALTTLNRAPQQINLKARFVTMTPEDMRAVGLEPFLPAAVAGNSVTNNSASTAGMPAVPGITGILTAPLFRTVLQAMGQRDGVALSKEGQVTTLSGHQAQFHISEPPFIVVNNMLVANGVAVTELSTNWVTPATASDISGTSPVPFGPTLDVIPSLGADGNTIQLTLIPSLVEVTGYDDRGVAAVANVPVPRFRVRQFNTSAIVWDGQTVVLGIGTPSDVGRSTNKIPVLADLPMVGRLFRSETHPPANKNLVIFVTPTLIDPAGNGLNTDKE